jgi:hypothetical protein
MKQTGFFSWYFPNPLTKPVIIYASIRTICNQFRALALNMNCNRLAVLAFAAFAPSALMAQPDVREQHDGVTLDAYSRNGSVTFCFNAEKDVKIASEYGVEFSVPKGEVNLWEEKLPKVVAGSEPYFDLPARIELKTRGKSLPRQILVGLGICVSDTYCTPVAFSVTIPANRGGEEAAACAR